MKHKNYVYMYLPNVPNLCSDKTTRGSQEPVIAHLVFNLPFKVDSKWGCYT